MDQARGPAMAEILILVDQTRGDQRDQGTRGPAMAEILILVDQTRGDQGTRGPGDQGTGDG